MIFGAVIFYLVGVLLLASGIAVWKGKTWLIHDYHRKNVTDVENYGKAMGKAISGMGVSAILGGSLFFFGEKWLVIGIGVFCIGFAAMFAIVYFIQRKYNGGMFS